MTNLLNNLPADQKAVLVRLCGLYGPKWRHRISQHWDGKAIPALSAQESAALEQFRNEKGPSYLAKIQRKDCHAART